METLQDLIGFEIKTTAYVPTGTAIYLAILVGCYFHTRSTGLISLIFSWKIIITFEDVSLMKPYLLLFVNMVSKYGYN